MAAVVFFGSLLLMVALAIGMGIVRAVASRPSPAAITLAPQPGLLVAGPTVRGGQAFTLVGVNWPPNQLVSVLLRDPARPDDPLPIFSGESNAQGELILITTYPTDARWADLLFVDIIVHTVDRRLEVARNVPVSRSAALLSPTPVAPSADTPTPSLTAAPQVFPDWKGEYFANPDLSGAPTLVRNDVQVAFNWGGGSPDAAVPADNFSARWTRSLRFPAGVHVFTVSADDGVRLFIDGLPLIDEWHTATGRVYTREVNLGEGVHHLRVEMYEGAGAASINFSSGQSIAFTDWKGEYFANRDLSGAPALTRNDTAISFDWGNGSPDARVPPDGFSARWTRALAFPAGLTRFVVRADDGVRLLIDGVRVIDEWHDASPTTYAREVNLAAGPHTLVVEYYENIGGASVKFDVQPATFVGWKGEYFANTNLSGETSVVRDDADLNFNWGDGSPAPAVPAEDFSARWTRTLDFEAGTYRFSLIVDDGGRLFLDNTRMIDEWHDGSSTYSFTIDLAAGSHTIMVEYYEHIGKARAGLTWARLSNTATPSATPSPIPTATASSTITPTYTSTPSATATPTLTPESP